MMTLISITYPIVLLAAACTGYGLLAIRLFCRDVATLPAVLHLVASYFLGQGLLAGLFILLGAGGVAAVLPETQTAGSHGVRGTVGVGDEVRSAEEMNEKVARNARAIGLPLAPLEKVFRVEWNFGSGAEEPR